MKSNSDLGRIRIEDLSEARQQSVEDLIVRCGTVPNLNEIKLIGKLMRRVEAARIA